MSPNGSDTNRDNAKNMDQNPDRNIDRNIDRNTDSNTDSKKGGLALTAGQALGISDWFAMDQSRIDAFAEVTLDFQAIHVKPEVAALTPFGGTIAHGLLTLSIVPHLLYPLLNPHITPGVTLVNYGVEALRFLQPVRSTDRIRLHARVQGVEEKEPGRILLRLANTVAIENSDKPALVSESLIMVLTAAGEN
ncbi:MaoC family dehydratase [Halioxenophilus aromaticivorans]|uniref:MaoC-like domain-containing protein n=1 Tax=Halioxenophilus aromaticivorans TaxID=1306992 RepID=A0AAV3U219_9ALTE